MIIRDYTDTILNKTGLLQNEEDLGRLSLLSADIKSVSIINMVTISKMKLRENMN